MKPDMKKGRIHVYSGNGKGKTTASIGLATRASGREKKVIFVQFLKSGKSAELAQLEKLGVSVFSGQPVKKFTFKMTEEEKAITRKFNDDRLQASIDTANNEGLDLLILDEAIGAMAAGVFSADKVLEFLRNKPETLEVVLTGRDPSEEILALADYHTEMTLHKHPYVSENLPGRPGIEF